MTNLYPDIYQGDAPVNLRGLRAKYSRVLIRAGVGITMDTQFDNFWGHARTLGFARQAYHRIKHWPGAPSISWQAQRLLDILAGDRGEMEPEVDMEQKPGDPPLPKRATCIELIRSWRNVVGGYPWLYTNFATLQMLEPLPSDILAMPLHIAWYPKIPAASLLTPELAIAYLKANKIEPPKKYNWASWQFSDNVQGYPLIAANASDWNISRAEWISDVVPMESRVYLPMAEMAMA